MQRGRKSRSQLAVSVFLQAQTALDRPRTSRDLERWRAAYDAGNTANVHERRDVVASIR